MGAVVCYVVSTKKFEKVVEVVWRWMSPEGRRQIFCCVFSNLENIGIHLEKNWKNYTEGLLEKILARALNRRKRYE